MAKAKPCKMAVTALGKTIDDRIGSLGRSKYLFIFEGSPDKFIVVGIPPHPEGVGAGLMVAKALIEGKYDVVVTGTIGKRAFAALKDSGISVKAGCTGTVYEAIRKCAAGELEECKGATFAGKVESW